jgi:hypothetical protein
LEKAEKPLETGMIEDAESISVEFYELCDDLEIIKLK